MQKKKEKKRKQHITTCPSRAVWLCVGECVWRKIKLLFVQNKCRMEEKRAQAESVTAHTCLCSLEALYTLCSVRFCAFFFFRLLLPQLTSTKCERFSYSTRG